MDRLVRSARHRLPLGGPAVVVGTLLLAGCDRPTRPEPVPSRVELSDSAVSLADDGSSARLQAAVLDGSGNPLDLPVTWRSSAPGIATVDSAGTVTSRGPGMSWITASHVRRDGVLLRDSAAVTVRTTPASIQVLPNKDFGGPGTLLPLTVRVLDRNGRGMPHVEVEFAVTRGSASVAPARATTGLLGTASTTLTLGQEPGQVEGVARVVGSEVRIAFLARVDRFSLQLDPDSLMFLAPGCGGEILARVGTSDGLLTGLSIPFSVTDSTVVTLEAGRGSGTLRGMHRLVSARKPGVTRIVAGYEGAADTAVVRVGPDTAAALVIGFAYAGGLATGDSARIDARVVNVCSADVAGATPTLSSSNPRVATLSGGWVRTHAAGRSLVVVRYGRFADSVLIDVKDVRVEPVDTTLTVGDTLRYRAFEADSTGVFVPARINGVGTSSSDVATIESGNGALMAVARQVGTATISVIVRSRFVPTTLRVVARSSAGASRALRPVRARPRR